MEPLINKAKLLQSLVNNYDVEMGQEISSAKIYNLIRAQPEVEIKHNTAYWYPAMDGDGWCCSNCNHDICYLQFEGNYEKFCRHCGAEMINAKDFICEGRKAWRLK